MLRIQKYEIQQLDYQNLHKKEIYKKFKKFLPNLVRTIKRILDTSEL